MSWNGKRILIVGLGLTGWSMLRYLHAAGAKLTVCDSRDKPPYAAELAGQFPSVALHVGSFDSGLLNDIDLLAVSPGLDLNQPLFVEARRRGLPLIGDIEIFARDNSLPVLAVTGSNGKSTVVTLLGKMLEQAGLRAAVGGNIGTPALDLLAQQADIVVLELSSFQLELTSSLRCVAASVLNLSPDHIDRHGDLASYGAAKARIFKHAAHAIVNSDDAAAAKLLPAGLPSSSFSIQGAADYNLQQQNLVVSGQVWMSADELKLVGAHNCANVLAAFGLGQAAGLPRDAMVTAAKQFGGLAHRCQWVADIDGVRWINDSKGTNVGATLAALEGLPPKVVLLAGGQAKGGDFAPWREPLSHKGRGVFLFGEDADKIATDLQPLSLPVRNVGELNKAVSAARELAESGDSVLLSPGCASFDQFSGYAERGEAFVELVEAQA